jgi:Tfp pilus assembly protein PilZ
MNRNSLLLCVFTALALGGWLGCGDDSTAPPTGPQPAPVDWAVRGGGPVLDSGNGVVTDGAGNVYVTGEFTGTADFDTTTLTDAGSGDALVLKYAKDGTFRWAVRGGGTGIDDAQAITADGTGNVYITGQFTSTAGFGAFDLVSAGSQDIYVAKYDTAGTVVWAESAGGPSFESGIGLASDANGNVVVTGFFRQSFMYGSTQLTSAGDPDIFVARYDPAGNVAWARQAGSTNVDVGMGVAMDASGRAVVTGTFEGTVQFGTTTLVSAGQRDVFVAMYDASGNVVWAKRGGGTSADVGYAAAVDGFGNTYVTGYFYDSADFGATTLTDAGNGDMFLVAYGPNGNELAAVRAGGSESETGEDIAIDPSGNVIVTGEFRGTSVFGSTSLTSAGRDDIFIAKFSSSGDVLWAWGAGTTGDDRGFGVAADRSDFVVSTGTFGGTVKFGHTSLTSVGATDIFVFRMGPNGI